MHKRSCSKSRIADDSFSSFHFQKTVRPDLSGTYEEALRFFYFSCFNFDLARYQEAFERYPSHTNLALTLIDKDYPMRLYVGQLQHAVLATIGGGHFICARVAANATLNLPTGS